MSSKKTRPTSGDLAQFGTQNRVFPEEYYDYDYSGGDYSSQTKKVRNKLGSNGIYGGGHKTRSSGYGEEDSYGVDSYGGGDVGYGGYGGPECDTGVSIGLLLTAALGIGVMLFTLFTKITMGRRRKRDALEGYSEYIPDFLPIVMAGMSYFYYSNTPARYARPMNLHLTRRSDMVRYSGGGSKCGGMSDVFFYASMALVAAVAFAVFRNEEDDGRREGDDSDDSFSFVRILFWLEDLEERIDKMVVGENQDDNSWIGSLYNKFKGAYSGQDADAQDEHGLEGLEPPNLDETWGLADTNLFHEEEGHNSTEHSRSPRSVDDKDNDNNEIPDEESIVKNMDLMDGFFTETNGCKFQLYKCIAGVVENGYHHAQKSGGVYEYAQKVLFKIAFNKGFGGGAWNAMMTAPEARKIQRCFNTQDDCLTQNILLKEVPEDSVKDSQQRLLINTEFVENLDKSNGSEPYDPENEPDYEE